MKNKGLDRLFSNKIFVLILSLVIAVVSWVAVVMTVSPNITRTIYNVPITYPKEDAGYQVLGLDIVNSNLESYTVNVTVEGDRSVVTALSPEDFTVTPIFTGVTAPGSYELVLSIDKSAAVFSSYTIRSISPASISLTFGTVVTESFNVEPVSSAPFTVPADYLINTITASPATVRITATQSALDSIARVVARVSGGREITKSEVTNSPVVLLDRDGNELSLAEYRIDYNTVDVTVPVYKYADIPLRVEFINLPEGFDAGSLDYEMSATTMRIAASETMLENLTELVVARINLAAFRFGEVYTHQIVLPQGVLNIDNLTSVAVSLPQEGLSTRSFNITNIFLTNESRQYTYLLKTARINGVVVIGPAAELDTLSADAIAAVVDLSSVSLESGENSLGVRFEIPSHPNVWVVGEYSVIVEVRPR